MTARHSMLAQIAPPGWLSFMTAAAAVVLLAVVIQRASDQPVYAPLVGGVDAATAARDTSLLDRYGVRWRLDGGGSVLAVDVTRLPFARELLARGPRPRRVSAGEGSFG